MLGGIDCEKLCEGVGREVMVMGMFIFEKGVLKWYRGVVLVGVDFDEEGESFWKEGMIWEIGWVEWVWVD